MLTVPQVSSGFFFGESPKLQDMKQLGGKEFEATKKRVAVSLVETDTITLVLKP